MMNYTFNKNINDSKLKSNDHMAPGTQIHYVPGLIDKLKKDHVKLLKLLRKAARHFEEQKYNKAVKKLHKFKGLFMEHLILENLKLYIYLKHSFTSNSELQNQVKDFRKEMRKVSKQVLTCIDKYNDMNKNKKLREDFEKDLKKVYLTLNNHLKREELELYPLYQDNF